MATYTYTGRLTDFGESPFPTAQPRLWVEPVNPAFGDGGLLAPIRIPITVATDGSFTVNLVPSSELRPASKYVIRCEWLAADGVVAGWTQWEFVAVVGGGPISDMVDGSMYAVWIGPPWPVGTPPGLYIDRTPPNAWGVRT